MLVGEDLLRMMLQEMRVLSLNMNVIEVECAERLAANFKRA